MSYSNIDLQVLHLRAVVKSPGYVFAATAVVLTTYCISKIIYNLYFHPLSKFPGPRLYAATYLPQAWDAYRGKGHLVGRALHDKYGEVVRISPGDLSFTGAQAWKDIYGYRVGLPQMPKDKYFYVRTGQGDTSDIIVGNDADHSRYRRTLSHAFSDKALRSSEPILEHYFNLLISQLQKRASSPSTSTVDLCNWYNWITFDIIGDLAFGEPFHALENADTHPYITAVYDGFCLSASFRILRRWNLDNVGLQGMKFVANWNKAVKKSLSGMLRGYSEEIMDRRLSPERMMSDRQDFMYHVLRQEGEKGMSKREMVMNASILVIAGSETTATFLSGTTYHLLKNPDVLKTLSDEVRGAYKSADEITLPSTVASEMPYLHAVIEEGLRMYPPVSVGLPRFTAEGTFVNGLYVPPNTAISVHQYASSHSSISYHNPDTFAPSRWLASPPPEYANDILEEHTPFSTGPRNCLGKNLAYAEMRCILARMIYNFDMELDPSIEDWVNKQKTCVLWCKDPLLVKLTKREVEA